MGLYSTQKKGEYKIQARKYCRGGLLTTTKLLDSIHLTKAVYGIFHTRGNHDLRPVRSCMYGGRGRGMLLALVHPSATTLQWKNQITFLRIIQYTLVFVFL